MYPSLSIKYFFDMLIISTKNGQRYAIKRTFLDKYKKEPKNKQNRLFSGSIIMFYIQILLCLVFSIVQISVPHHDLMVDYIFF